MPVFVEYGRLLPLLVALGANINAPAGDTALSSRSGPGAPIRFNRDIRPVLADNCYACHGPDKNRRKAGLRLDLEDGAKGDLGGRAAVVAGNPDRSELLRRITAGDPDDHMPPAISGKELSDREISLLREWIRQGARWEGHWAYLPPSRTPLPPVRTRGWQQNPVDRFIAAKLESRRLKPSPEADRVTLIRRLSFDLTGLPPKPGEVDAFVKDRAAAAYERVVDRLLASAHYGERMAMYWLDLVRYGDTVGYHGDQPFNIFPYRDYVIRAFNNNLPFDRFTREQLAGDLLPAPDRQQRVASGYNRLNMMTAEGGAQDKEYRIKYAADRVRNASTVWLGATLGCAECHDHKFDPYTTKDFYSFSAFFADLTEKGFYDRGFPHGDWGTSIQVPTPEQETRLAELTQEIAALQRVLVTPTPELEAGRRRWEQQLATLPQPRLDPWHVIGPFPAAGFDAAFKTAFPPEKEINLSKAYLDGKLRWTAKPEWDDGRVHELTGTSAATYLVRSIHSDAAQTLALSLGSDDAIRVWLNGSEVLSNKVNRAAAPDQEKITLRLQPGENRLLMKIVNGDGGYAFYFKPIGTAPPEILAILKIAETNRSADQQDQVASFYRSITPDLDRQRAQLATLQRSREDLDRAIPTTLVALASSQPRVVRILPRGNWLAEDGEVVEPALPHFLAAPAAPGRRLTRLDLANWIVSPENPLASRVFVNRLWKQFFGTGLSKRLDDLGAQGEWPTHPELLDWLAVEFRETGWDVKRLVRLLVLSNTYRQASLDTPALRETDPDNRLLARQSRFRVEAELVRDTALAVSGLLVPTIGGPSVKPYQPPGYYAQLNFPKRDYDVDHGPAQYRRGLYTHWQRTYLHPSLAAFDAPTREECTVERIRSNTPQQALVLLNDPTYVEAARAFAERLIREGGPNPKARIEFAYREALGRKPRAEESALLVALQQNHLAQYRSEPAAASGLMGVGDRRAADDLAVDELASWTSVARVVLNLHATVTRN